MMNDTIVLAIFNITCVKLHTKLCKDIEMLMLELGPMLFSIGTSPLRHRTAPRDIPPHL